MSYNGKLYRNAIPYIERNSNVDFQSLHTQPFVTAARLLSHRSPALNCIGPFHVPEWKPCHPNPKME